MGFSKSRRLTLNKIRFLNLMAIMVAGLILIGTISSSAQNRRNRPFRDSNRGNAGRLAESQGYNDGLREGIDDARKRRRHNPYGNGRYRKATNGYNSRYGNKEVYKRVYRRAFINGYNQGFYRRR